jgi:hypothetical protein
MPARTKGSRLVQGVARVFGPRLLHFRLRRARFPSAFDDPAFADEAEVAPGANLVLCRGRGRRCRSLVRRGRHASRTGRRVGCCFGVLASDGGDLLCAIRAPVGPRYGRVLTRRCDSTSQNYRTCRGRSAFAQMSRPAGSPCSCRSEGPSRTAQHRFLSGAAQESNLLSDGLRRLTGFEASRLKVPSGTEAGFRPRFPRAA